MTYRVQLPVFSGPLDLLLHLVKQQEVRIHEVRIATILGQYLEHLKILQTLDLDDIGEFIVMASTLMEIKSKELLPNEEISIEDELDPRDDLIQRLLEYKRFRDISRRLDRYSRRRARMLDARVTPPRGLQSEREGPLELELGEVDIWSLTAAFAKLLEETGSAQTSLHIDIERRNVLYYTELVLSKVRTGADVPFASLFDPAHGRFELIGVFVAVLEMMKQGFLRAHQPDCFGEIVVAYCGPSDLRAEDVTASGREHEEEVDETEASETEAAEGPAPDPSLN